MTTDRVGPWELKPQTRNHLHNHGTNYNSETAAAIYGAVTMCQASCRALYEP